MGLSWDKLPIYQLVDVFHSDWWLVVTTNQIVKIRGPKSPVKIHSQFGTTRTGGYKKKHRFTLW